MKTVRVAVVGTGIWGTAHVRAYSQHASAELVAVCDLDEARARKVAGEWRVPAAYTSVDEMLHREKLDGVSVATPDRAHTAVVCACAAAGVHVLVEKPLATTVAECERMIETARMHGVHLMVDWHNRWNPPCYATWKAIRDGELGDVRYIYYRLSDTVYVPLKMLPWASESNVLRFLGSHALDTTCWFMQKPVARVTCRRQRGALAALGVDTPDLYLTVLDFEDGSAAAIENSWLLPQSSPALIDHKIEVIGTRGVIYLDPTHGRTMAKHTALTPQGYPHAAYPDMSVTPEVHGRQVGFAVESIYHFVDCLRDGKTPLTSGEDGLLNTRLLIAAEQSADGGGAPVEP